MRCASIWPEGDPEVEADRIHKFMCATPHSRSLLYYRSRSEGANVSLRPRSLSDPTQELRLCAETEEIMREWVVGVAAVVSMQMLTFSIEEVGQWLRTNRLSKLVPVFRDHFVDGHKLVEMHTIDSIPPEVQQAGAEQEIAILTSRVARMLGLDDSGNSPASRDMRPAGASQAMNSSGYDCVLVHKPEDADVVDAMVQLFPAPGDGLGEWKIFKSSLDTTASVAELDEHRELVRTTPNLIFMLTRGFFRRELDDKGREILNPRLELVIEALQVAHLNVLCVYTWDFKIPRPSRLPESVRPILKLDFHKLDLEISDVALACTKRICSDLISDRHGDRLPFQWQNIQQAVFSCIEMKDPAEQMECFATLTHLSATLDGERQLYECHGVEAAAEALGCSVSRVKGGTVLTQVTPVTHRGLMKMILVNFLMATFNKYDQATRAAVIGFDGGIHALIGSMLAMQEEESCDERDELLMLALVLCSRLGRNEPNMRKMRLIGTVKMARRCLTYSNRDLRALAEKTITEILNLDATM